VLKFLSDDWIDALDAAGSAGRGGPGPALEGQPVLTIEQRISDPANGETRYAVLIYDEGIRVQKGPTDNADVAFVSDRDTAAAIAQGEVSAQAAFMSGGLRLIGEAAALLASQAALTDLADRFAAVRAETQW
jgi:putative sterol carrier protein